MLPGLGFSCNGLDLPGSLPVCKGLSVPLLPYSRPQRRPRGKVWQAEPIRKGNGEKDPLAETCPVPAGQQPVKELQALQASRSRQSQRLQGLQSNHQGNGPALCGAEFLHVLQEIFAFNWATLPMPQLLTRLGESCTAATTNKGRF